MSLDKILDDTYTIGKTDATLSESHDDWPTLKPNVKQAVKDLLLEQLDQLRIEQTEPGDFYQGLALGNNLAVDMIQILVREM